MENDKLYNKAILAALEAGERIMSVYTSDDFQVTEKADNSPLTIADKAAHNTILACLKETGIPVLSEEGRSIPYEERSRWSRFWLVDPLDGTKEFIKRNGEFTVNIALIENGTPEFGVVFAPVLNLLYVGICSGREHVSWEVKTEGTANENRFRKDAASSAKNEPTKDFINKLFGDIRILGDTAYREEATHTPWRVVASRSHLNGETENYLNQLRQQHGAIELVSRGSSLKLCMVASGEADEYPRLGPTMEWDVAAAHAVVKGAGMEVVEFAGGAALRYNKGELLNPHFIARRVK